MTEYIVDLTNAVKRKFSWSLESLMDTAPVREEIVRCRDCMYARESYWDDGERKHADPMSKLCWYFGGKITVPLDFYCKAGERKVDGE